MEYCENDNFGISILFSNTNNIYHDKKIFLNLSKNKFINSTFLELYRYLEIIQLNNENNIEIIRSCNYIFSENMKSIITKCIKNIEDF
jgi:flagellin-specific chaperone FliS